MQHREHPILMNGVKRGALNDKIVIGLVELKKILGVSPVEIDARD